MDVPEVVVNRLPQYVRALRQLMAQGNAVVSSHLLGQTLQMTPAQIRKDLSYFGRFGKQGRGYTIAYLLTELQDILQLDHEWNMAVVGVGRLGRAIISYPGFAPEGFKVVAAFDADERQVGQSIGGLIVQPMQELPDTVRQKSIQIGIVAVPAAQASDVMEQITYCGIRAILNYAPVNPHTPLDVKVRNIDPVLSLQSMTYYLRSADGSGN